MSMPQEEAEDELIKKQEEVDDVKAELESVKEELKTVQESARQMQDQLNITEVKRKWAEDAVTIFQNAAKRFCDDTQMHSL